LVFAERVANRASKQIRISFPYNHRPRKRAISKMKRKANVFDEHSSWDSWSPLSDASTASYRSLDQNAVGIVPWTLAPTRSHIDDHINFRTKKRVRDNRPDLDAIHQNTLAKLFNAQRQQVSLLSDAHSAGTGDVHDQVMNHSPTESAEPAQRSLHSFFNVGQRQGSAKQAPPSTQQRAGVAFNSCEDCSNELNQSARDRSHEWQMMEVDQMQGPLMDEDYECAVCSRNVCDMCAVRGDRRICLECAMPGAG